MLVKLSAAVYGSDGEITSIAKLDGAGKIEFTKMVILGERKTRIAYLATIKGTNKAWEIGKRAYLSRTRK